MPNRPGLSIALGFIAFLGSAHILIRTSLYGVEYHNDAGVYFFDAELLAYGKVFQSGGLLWSPPLFAAVLSLYRLLGVEPSDVGQYLNIMSFGLIILVVGYWLHRVVRFRLIMIGTTIAIIISYPLVRISSQILSEVLFVLLALLALINLESFLSGRKVKSGFWLLTAFSALAFLTRYLGVTVIFIGTLFILTRREPLPRVKWRQAACYGVMSSLPTALWMTRNWIVMGSLTGRNVGYTATRQSLWDSLIQLGDELHLWIFVQNDFGWLDICFWAAIALAGFEAAKALAARSIPPPPGRKGRLFQKIGISFDIKERPVLPFAAFATMYLVTLFVIAPYMTGEPPANIRYLLPIYVPVVMAAAVRLEQFLLKTYQNSGISVWKSSNNWGINYHRASGPMAIRRWIIIGLILTILLTSFKRNIVLYIDILTIYDPYGYQF